MWHRCFREVEHRKHVGAEYSFHLCGVEVFEVLFDMLFRSIVDEDIDPPKSFYGKTDRLPAQFLFANVSVDEQALPSFVFDHVTGLFFVIRLIEIQERDVGTFLCKGNGDCATNAAVASRDHGDSIFQLSARPISLLTASGLRVHDGLQAWLACQVLFWKFDCVPAHVYYLDFNAINF